MYYIINERLREAKTSSKLENLSGNRETAEPKAGQRARKQLEAAILGTGESIERKKVQPGKQKS